MINLKVEEYCQNCRDFEAKVTANEFTACSFDESVVRQCDTIITCSHAKRCEGIKRYLESVSKEV